MHTPTVTLRFSQALIQAAAKLGLTFDSPPSHERVPIDVQDTLWESLCSRASDPLIGVQLGMNLQVGHLDVAGLLVMSCDTYGEALDALFEYLPIIGEGGDVHVRHDGAAVELHYTPRFTVRQAERVESVLSGILHLGRWSTGGRFQVLSMHFQHAPLDDASRYPGLLGCPVSFSQSGNYLRFEKSALDLPLIQANSAVRDHLRALADETLRHLGEQSLSASVAELICQHPRAGKERIADLLAISGRHLTRRLADEGLSFKQLRDRELLKLAEAGLARDDKIAAIAEALGFSDESAFAKAFRRWTGTSPAQFRDR